MKLIEFGLPRGKFSDVQADPQGWVCVAQDEATGDIVLFQATRDGVRRVADVRITCGGGNAYPRLHIYDGQTYLAYRRGTDAEGILHNLTTGVQTLLGVVHANDPICMGGDRVAYQADGVYRVDVRALTDPARVVTLGQTGRPTGLSSVDANGRVTLVDDVRLSVPGMVNPRRAGVCTVGENATGPDRNIAQLDDKRTVDLWPGQASFTPRIAFDGSRYAVATWGAPQGVRVALLDDADFKPPVVVVPPTDTKFVVDPNGVIEDISPWLFNPAHKDIFLSPDGKVRFNLKSDEVSGDVGSPTIGEWWDRSDTYIGHLEDSSAGFRIYQGKRYRAEDWVKLGEPVPWGTLKLDRNTFKDGARLWLPRRCVTGWSKSYVTDITWTSGWVQPRIGITISVEVGRGIVNGKVARVRGVYNPGTPETNYYGEDGWIGHSRGTDPWKAAA